MPPWAALTVARCPSLPHPPRALRRKGTILRHAFALRDTDQLLDHIQLVINQILSERKV